MDDVEFPVFDPGITTLDAFADYVEEFRYKPCTEAIAWLRQHDWTDVDEAPFEYAYHLLLEFRDVQGPIFRAGTVERLGGHPFWAALAWITIPGLDPGEYGYLFSRWYYRYPERGRLVLEGSIAPGSRAIVLDVSREGRT